MNLDFIRNKVREELYDLSEHAHRERMEEGILIEEIERILLEGGIIEKYKKDPRGESCLVAGVTNNKPLHVICGTRRERLLIITVYRPKMPIWKDYKTRVKEIKSRV